MLLEAFPQWVTVLMIKVLKRCCGQCAGSGARLSDSDPPFTICVASGKLRNFVVPRFLRLPNRDNHRTYHHRCVVLIRWVICVKHWEECLALRRTHNLVLNKKAGVKHVPLSWHGPPKKVGKYTPFFLFFLDPRTFWWVAKYLVLGMFRASYLSGPR